MHLTGFWEFFQNHVEIEVVDVVVVAGLVGCNQSPRHRTTNRFVQGQKRKKKRKISISFFLKPCIGE